MFNWAGIYKRDFLKKYHIRYNETPGAAFQDNGFYVQAFALAKRVYFIQESFYRYRLDNPNSSINNPNRIFSMCDEYDFAEERLRQYPGVIEKKWYRYLRKRYGACAWAFKKVKPEYRYEVAKRMYRDFSLRLGKKNEIALIQDDEKYIRQMEALLDGLEAYLSYMEGEINQIEENVKSLCERVKECETFYIFGAGEVGNRLQIELLKYNLMPEAFFDNDKSKHGKKINGIRIIAPDAARYDGDALFLVSMTLHTDEVVGQLASLGAAGGRVICIDPREYFWD